ncbi:GlxA family transcriptional regulator [Asticcacaulis solisilvae]|uniref:GlxA family transcriptional regulator n=1 Tax=Asticcacaulis solisilvae TaxID=1217274 RepID=UPI003FD7B684
MKPVIVSVVAFDRISPFHLSVPCLVFGEDRSDIGLPPCELRVCSGEPGPLNTKVAMGLIASHDLSGLDDADIIIVPSWRAVDERPSQALSAALRAGKARGALIVGLCLGAVAIAASGVADGCEITTHWLHADRLRDLYPAVTVTPDVLYVESGNVITSAGVAAALDCCLHIVRRLWGAEAANQLARRLVLAPHRQGGQAQFIERPVAKRVTTDAFARTIDAVLAMLNQPHDLDSVAAMAGMTRRTFTRRFQKAFGMSFGQWLIERRVALAQQLLETTQRPVEDIAYEAGFGSPVSLRQHFAARLGVAPVQYRRAFAA